MSNEAGVQEVAGIGSIPEVAWRPEYLSLVLYEDRFRRCCGSGIEPIPGYLLSCYLWDECAREGSTMRVLDLLPRIQKLRGGA